MMCENGSNSLPSNPLSLVPVHDGTVPDKTEMPSNNSILEQKQKTLNRTVLPLRPLHKTRTAEMQLKDNRIKVTEELRRKLRVTVA